MLVEFTANVAVPDGVDDVDLFLKENIVSKSGSHVDIESFKIVKEQENPACPACGSNDACIIVAGGDELTYHCCDCYADWNVQIKRK